MQEEKYSIFIVEDDEDIANALKRHLGNLGYTVWLAENFLNIDEQVSRLSPSLVLMDIQLPYFSGFHWCNVLRKQHSMPIVFLSGRADNLNIVSAMELGGDDFMEKPFDFTVLSAKISAILRHSYQMRTPADCLSLGQIRLNLLDGSLSYLDKSLPLSKNELQILAILFENKGKFVDKESMMLRLWNSDSFIDDNTLAVNIARLRKKLADFGIKDLVQSKKGMGYMVQP